MIGDASPSRRKLRKIVALQLLLAFIACVVLFVSALGPDANILEQRAADRAAWEKERTAEQRTQSDAWDKTVREVQRERGLISAVFLLGNITIVMAAIRSTRASAHAIVTQRLSVAAAFAKVLRQTTVGLWAAFGILIAVPTIESVVVDLHGMYHGEQMLSAILTVASFLIAWVLSVGIARLALSRRSRECGTESNL